MAMHFQNPVNGYIETSGAPFLWSFFFGAFYFAYKGVWLHFWLYWLVAICTMGIGVLIYPFLAKGIVYKAYARRGWMEVGSAARQQPQQQQEPAITNA
jgi:hypothetical protein